MFKSLHGKLALAFVLVVFAASILVAVFVRASSSNLLTRLILEQQSSRVTGLLANYYALNGSWDGVGDQWRIFQASGNEAGANDDSHGMGNMTGQRMRRLFGLADEKGVVLVSIDTQYPVGSKLPRSVVRNSTAVVVNGETVGTLLRARSLTELNPEESSFLQRTNRVLLLAVAGSVLAALLIGLLLARTLTRPLNALTQAARAIAGGNLQQQVQVTSQDEIGQLAEAFNRMSAEVARVNQQRKQMTADIAHDLRTPLTVVGGYVESMRDGVLQPTPRRLDLIYSEIERLQRLVNDLRMLSQVDAGELPLNPQLIQPASLLQQAAEVFQHQAQQGGITLQVNCPPDLPMLRVDEARMMQVLGNLLSNALRYTPAGGQVTLLASTSPGKVQLAVQDTGSGIPPQELGQIFDRFHRADKSRHSENGESGLGLAIVKALVTAHNGRVWAESIAGQGTVVRLELPSA